MSNHELPGEPEQRPMPEDDVKRELECAATLTEVIGILYRRVNEVEGSIGTYTPDDLAAIILNATDDLRGWQRQKLQITNVNLPLRATVNRILFEQGELGGNIARPPTFVDWLLRKNFGKGGKPETTFAPVEDMPTDPAFYRRPITEEEYYKAVGDFRPTYRHISNREFIA